MVAIPKVQRVLPFILLMGLVGLLVGLTRIEGLNQVVHNAIAIDLMLTVPAIYLLIIYRRRVSNMTMVPVAVGGYVLGSIILPRETITLTYAGTYVLPLVELGLIAYLIYNVRRLRKAYRTERLKHPSPVQALKETFAQIYPRKLSAFLSYELSLLYFAFAPNRVKNRTEGFSYGGSGANAIYITVLFLVIVETGVIHLLLVSYSPMLAWTLSALSIYSGIIILGIMRSRFMLPVIIRNDTILLRYGIWRSVSINTEDIEEVSLKSDNLALSLSPLGELEEHNITVYLKKTCTIDGLYGLDTSAKSLTFYLDNPEEFIQWLNKQ